MNEELLYNFSMAYQNTKAWKKALLRAVVLFLFWIPTYLAAQDGDIRFGRISVEDGLSQNAVNCICQDSKGFLWFGTQDGLNRYDGYNFIIYKHDPQDQSTLSDNFISDILEDRAGILWIGTQSGGLNRFDRNSGRFIRYTSNSDNSHGLGHNRVNAIYEDQAGILWIGTFSGLNAYDHKNERFTLYTHDPANPFSLSCNQVTAIYEDRTGVLWIGTEGGGLNRFDRKDGRFVNFVHDAADLHSLGNNYINCIFEDRSGILWCGTEGGGLNGFDKESGQFTRYTYREGDPSSLSNDKVHTIYEDRSGTLWIGTWGGGLNRFDKGRKSFTRYIHDTANLHTLSNNTVIAIFEDQSQLLWIGTMGGGLNTFNRKSERFAVIRHDATRSQSLSNNMVVAFHEDRSGALWIGTWGGGLDRFDRKKGRFTHFTHDPANPNSLSHNWVNTIHEDRFGILWVGTIGGGLNALDRERRRFTHYYPSNDPGSISHDKIITLYEDQAGVLWIGTHGGGLNAYDRKNRRFTHYTHDPLKSDSLSHDSIISIHEDRFGLLWIGTWGGGLNSFDRKSGHFTRYTHDAENFLSLSHNSVTSIYEDRAGELWVGTFDGLNQLDRKTGEFRVFREKDGLPNNVTLGILEDSRGDLWLSTNKGISRFNPKTGTFKNYDINDGLQGNEFNSGAYYKNQKGEMFFGGANGFNAFLPEQITDDPYIPPIVITDFLISNKSVPLQQVNEDSPLVKVIDETRKITLSYEDNLFSFEFAALHFVAPAKNQYAYKLEGWNEDWIETDSRNRRAVYTNLPGGDYVFKVKGSNKDGVWNDEGASIELKILPPPWKTWWAYLLYSLILAGIVLGFLRSQSNKLKKERLMAQKERSVSRQLRQLDKLKDEFLSNTSHELRTPLNGIIGLAESLMDGATGKLPIITVANLSMIASSGKRLASLVNDILDFSRLKDKSLVLQKKPVDMYTLTDVVLTLSRPLTGNKVLELVNAIEPGVPAVEADENRLQQIMYNLVGNAVKFTDSGVIKVSAEIEAEQLLVRVSDTGIGIPEENFERIFESFEQVDGSAGRAYEGTGLGLAVTRKLVELHDGKIWVESTVGKGSTFNFTLPLSREKAEKKPKPVSPPALTGTFKVPAELVKKFQQMADAPEKDQDMDHFHILVVDDDAVNRQVLVNFLSLQNYTVTEASSGANALEIIESKRQVDLSLLDIMMPGMSGYEVCKKIRKRFSSHELPVIFLSAKNQASDLAAGFSAGGNDFVTKPVSRAEMLARVRTHLELLEINRNLEQKVEARTQELRTKNRQITSSIQYAQSIQATILPDEEEIAEELPEHFVLFKPKDIVSGDFYWFHVSEESVFLAVVDCTGHGVPAAFMSMMGFVLLNNIIVEQKITDPAAILEQLNFEVRSALRQRHSKESVDGMDVCLCRIQRGQRNILYAGAKMPLYWVKQGPDGPEIVTLKGDRKSIGGRRKRQEDAFSTRQLELAKGDMIYLATDGFADQSDKHDMKYGSMRLRALLTKISSNDMQTQKKILTTKLAEHQGGVEQRDDITVFGVRL